MNNLKILHVGCGGQYHEGYINCDKREEWKGKKYKLDVVLDLGQKWPWEDSSIDGIVGMHVFQQLTWRELVVAFNEALRVLKKGGALRMGCPMVECTEYPLEYLLGWNNINLFSIDLLKRVLVDRIGFTSMRKRGYGRSSMTELSNLDNRPQRGTIYIEVIK
jgi:hypothetical protein